MLNDTIATAERELYLTLLELAPQYPNAYDLDLLSLYQDGHLLFRRVDQAQNSQQ